MLHGQYTPPMHQDDYFFPPSGYDTATGRERSHTPPMFTYSTYPAPPAPEDMAIPPYDTVPGYTHQPYHRESSYPEYLSPPPVPVTLPSMTHFTDAIKREPGYPEDTLPSYMSYQSYSIPGVDISSAAHPSPYDHMPHVSCHFPALPSQKEEHLG
ncbi:hypothetical protein VTJ49DRAFT_2035 [Mycothermus thermophilus]|uniref:Uncharacterized protein n=1 Tax=Humicola insolens TaxID=85995 RepID=A0ABR3VB69_HUMIN